MTGPLRRHFDLVGRAHSFRALFFATLGSGIGTWLAVVALGIDVYDRTGSTKWVSALLIADFLPAIVIGLALGPLVDRLSRKRLMIVSDLARFAIFAALPFVNSVWGIVVLAGLAGFATGFFRPAAYAGVPNLVDEADLPNANALLQSTDNLTTMVGPLAGGLLVGVTGADAAYVFNAATFLVSALFIARIPGRLLQSEESYSRGHLHDVAEGFALVVGSRPLLTVLIVWNVVMLANGLFNVSEIAFAIDTLDAGAFGYGLLWAGSGLGLVVGSLGAPDAIARLDVGRVYRISLALFGLGIAAAAVSPSVWIAAAALVISGAGNGAAIVCNVTLVQTGAPDRLRGRAFTTIMSSNWAVLVGAMIAAGYLTEAVGARWVFAIAATCLAVATVLATALARGLPRPVAEPRVTAVDPATGQSAEALQEATH